MAGVAQRQLCKVLCGWDRDEPVMLLGTPWKMPTSHKSKEIGDETRHVQAQNAQSRLDRDCLWG